MFIDYNDMHVVEINIPPPSPDTCELNPHHAGCTIECYTYQPTYRIANGNDTHEEEPSTFNGINNVAGLPAPSLCYVDVWKHRDDPTYQHDGIDSRGPYFRGGTLFPDVLYSRTMLPMMISHNMPTRLWCHANDKSVTGTTVVGLLLWNHKATPQRL